MILLLALGRFFFFEVGPCDHETHSSPGRNKKETPDLGHEVESVGESFQVGSDGKGNKKKTPGGGENKNLGSHVSNIYQETVAGL